MQTEKREKPVISVIMLTYNRASLVGRAIHSILAQTLTDFELIIVDNGSTDGSGPIIDAFAEKDPRVRVIHTERGTIGRGRNIGLNAAQGEFVAFVDDDDAVEPDFLAYLYQLALAYDSDVAICGFDQTEGDVVTRPGVFSDILLMDAETAIITLMWRKRYSTGFPTKLIRRSLFQDLRFPERDTYEDIRLMYKVLAGAKQVVHGGEAKYHVFRHEGNNSAATAKDRFISDSYLDEYRRAYRDRTLWLVERFPHREDIFRYFEWSFLISMVNKVSSSDIASCDAHLREMLRELRDHQEDFLASPYIQGFEREWMERYVLDGARPCK